MQKRIYNPDFSFEDFDFILEVKGKLDSATRKKMRDVKKAHPEKDIRFLFIRDNKLAPKNPERYSDWATKYGFPFAIKNLPEEWFTLQCQTNTTQ